MKRRILDFTPAERADLIDRLRHRPTYVTAAEKAMLADLVDRHGQLVQKLNDRADSYARAGDWLLTRAATTIRDVVALIQGGEDA